jgi:hypothetical protein
MHRFLRLGWLFLCGFAVAAGVSLALALATYGARVYIKSQSETYKPPDPQDYQPPKPGELQFSDLSFTEITLSAGVQGNVINKTGRPITSFRVDVDFKRKNALLYSCSETVVLNVAPATTKRFQLICEKVDRRALTDDIKPELKVVWVYHGEER